jgi:hypothetical protein
MYRDHGIGVLDGVQEHGSIDRFHLGTNVPVAPENKKSVVMRGFS